MIIAHVSAFQMDSNAILTVKDGEELITSGIYPVQEIDEDTMLIGFGEHVGWMRVKVLERDFDPAKVGVVEGQRRFTWTGTLELDS